MTGRASVVMVVCVAAFVLACSAQAAKGVALKSKNPLYGKIAMAGKTVRIVNLALDESKGTGKGYDTLYVDSNGNRRFEASERLQAPKTAKARSSHWLGIKLPISGVFRTPIAFSEANASFSGGSGEKTLYISAHGSPATKDSGLDWNYSLNTSLKLSPSLAKAQVSTLAAPSLDVTIQSQSGAVGFGMSVKCGDFDVSSMDEEGSPSATFAIKDESGGVVESGTGDLDKFGFG